MPGIQSTLERGGLPCRLLALPVQVIAEKWRLDILAKLTRCLVSAERNDADAVTLFTLPLAVIPRAGNDEIRVLRVVFFGMTENLPRAPGIFLIPESGDIEIRHSRGVKLVHPGFLLPELVVIGMVDG